MAVPGFYDDVVPSELTDIPFDEEAYRREVGVIALHGEPGYSTLERLWALSLRIWHLVLERVAALPAAVDEQRALLDALVSGDARRAGARMR